jgi:hypothetical protein
MGEGATQRHTTFQAPCSGAGLRRSQQGLPIRSPSQPGVAIFTARGAAGCAAGLSGQRQPLCCQPSTRSSVHAASSEDVGSQRGKWQATCHFVLVYSTSFSLPASPTSVQKICMAGCSHWQLRARHSTHHPHTADLARKAHGGLCSLHQQHA